MVHFVGAGPGAPDLITVRGKQYLEEADVIIYAGSLVNPQLLEYSKDVCNHPQQCENDTGRSNLRYGESGERGKNDSPPSYR